MTYAIETAPLPNDVDIGKVSETLRSLKIGKKNSFVIPASELMDASGKWGTTSVGQRVHHAAARLGIRVKVKREGKKSETPGLRVWRIE